MGLSAPVTTALDPEVWRKNYAFGISLTAGDTAGGLIGRYASRCGGSSALEKAIEEMPPDVIRWHLRCALSELQTKLGIPLGVTIIKSDPIDDGLLQGVDYDVRHARLPYTHAEADRWYRIDVPGPVISVERVRAYYYGQLIWEFSTARDSIDLIRLEWPTPGSMHILPINFQQVIVTQAPLGGPGNYGVWHTLGQHRSPVPDFWSVDWTKGPIDKETGTPSMLEMVLINWVHCVAGQQLLSLAGLAKSKGITSSSVSFDGLSRSLGLSGPDLYRAVSEAFQAAEKRIDWPTLRKYKRGLRVRMMGW